MLSFGLNLLLSLEIIEKDNLLNFQM